MCARARCVAGIERQRAKRDGAKEAGGRGREISDFRFQISDFGMGRGILNLRFEICDLRDKTQ